MSCVTFLLFFLSTVYFGISAFLIYVCIWLLNLYHDASYELNDVITDTGTDALIPVVILLVMSCIMMVVSIVGCCGTCRKNKTCIFVFCVVLICAVSLEIGSGLMGVVYRIEANHNVKEAIDKSIDSYNNTGHGPDKVIDLLQNKLQCCGDVNASDWINTTYWLETHKNGTEIHLLPNSCCVDKSTICKLTVGNFYEKGCFKPVVHKLKKYLTYGFGFCFGFAILQVFGILISCIRVVSSRNLYKRYVPINGGTYA